MDLGLWHNKTVVYTAITGGYDEPHRPPAIPNVDFVYFTDMYDIHGYPDGYVRSEIIAHDNMDPRRRAKIPKLNPWLYNSLKEYRYAIWIDGAFEVINTHFPRQILDYMESGMVISPHFTGKDCAYEEADNRGPKYINEPLTEQAKHYRKEGFPEHYGLYECGVIVWDMMNPQAQEVGRLWLNENIKWSYQDQVSLPYVLWKTGFKPDILPKSWREYNWLHWHAHLKEEH